MDEVTREAVGDILRSTLERVRRASDLLETDSPAVRELSIAQRLIETCLQAITGDVSVPASSSPSSLTPPTGASPDGGAMPYSVSLRRPSALIHAVVHAGASAVSSRSSSTPALASASRMPAMMSSVAGHPEYVGVTRTMTV